MITGSIGIHFIGVRLHVINRKGMKEILDKTYMRDQSAWELKEPHILVADELIYHFVSRTYTSTYPWIAGRDVDKGNYKALTFGRSTSRPMLEDAKPRDEIIAVVMSLRCEHEDDIIEGLETLKVDMAMLTRSNPKSSWFVNVVLVEEKLSPIFENHSVKLKLPSHHLHFFVSVNERRFNKFLFVPKVKVFLKDYEYVLFKDNDIPLSGFAWNTFMDLKKDAIIAGPFINKISKAFRRKWKMSYKQNEYVIFQDSSYFNHYNFNTYLDMSVFHSNLLEMQIVLMKTDFSLWFFDQIETYMDEEVDWGIDLMWCKAADSFIRMNEESRNKLPCALVSLDALDSTTNQISRSATYEEDTFTAFQRYKSSPTISKWIDFGVQVMNAFEVDRFYNQDVYPF